MHENTYGDLDTFGGFQIKQWNKGDALGDPKTTIHRLSTDYDSDFTFPELMDAYLAQEGIENIQGLVSGYWGTDTLMDEDINLFVQPLLKAAQKLSNIKALYINDISQEESEVSWIENTNLGPVIKAFPHLVHLGIVGGNGLRLNPLHSSKLRHLIIKAGGLSQELVRDVVTAHLPNLEHLELYLGTEDYGASSSAEDLAPLLDGIRFPKLKYLGLKNSDYQDEIAQIFSSAPILKQLETLDFSYGILTDEGGQALCYSSELKSLKKLDLHFHWMSEEMMSKLQQHAKRLNFEIDLSDPQGDDDDDWRYVALGE